MRLSQPIQNNDTNANSCITNNIILRGYIGNIAAKGTKDINQTIRLCLIKYFFIFLFYLLINNPLIISYNDSEICLIKLLVSLKSTPIYFDFSLQKIEIILLINSFILFLLINNPLIWTYLYKYNTFFTKKQIF